MVNFTPLPALIGGVLIGLAATLLMGLNGRIAGISGILGGLLPPGNDARWRLAFVIGLVCGGGAYVLATGGLPPITSEASTLMLIAGGLLVGYGTRLGSGCTSGHGVCGIGRLSPRGIVSTVIYIGVAAITVFVTQHVMGA
ncbi:MAG: YeeE/YedE family protein [Alphaproteobacteria bacterium]